MLEALGVSLAAGGQRLIEDVSFSARPGELTLIIGPNGAGKSTLLSLLSGLRQPDRGTVRYDGTTPLALGVRRLARLRAVVEQQPGWQPGLRAEELVMMGGYLAAHGQGDWRAAMRLARCDDLTGRRLETLSGGERQRLQLARAMLQLMVSAAAPRYLLLDEPTAALDFGLADALIADVRQWTRQYRLGAVAVVHDLNLALRHADRVLLMDNGRGAAFGPADDVMQKTRLEAIYGVRLAELVSDDERLRAFVPLNRQAS